MDQVGDFLEISITFYGSSGKKCTIEFIELMKTLEIFRLHLRQVLCMRQNGSWL